MDTKVISGVLVANNNIIDLELVKNAHSHMTFVRVYVWICLGPYLCVLDYNWSIFKALLRAVITERAKGIHDS